MEASIQRSEQLPRYDWPAIADLRSRDVPWAEIAPQYEASESRIRSAFSQARKAGKVEVQQMEPATASARLLEDVQAAQAKRTKIGTDQKYKAAVDRIQRLETQLSAFEKVDSPLDVHSIEPKSGAGVSEAAIVVLASDWHVEERVDPATVNGKNSFNLVVAKKRSEEFFQGVLRLAQILQRDVQVSTMVLALLGDFISGDIHDELMETAELEPVHAMLEVRNWIASGLSFLLKQTTYDFVIPCHSGNHARTTQQSRNATEAGHSLEYVMYQSLADHFRDEPRIKFIIPKSYHSYVQIYGTKLRFSHGHAIRYGGGVGGPTIPINKAIANWNTVEWADIDCFGHLHQRLDGENFVMNGSLIGYNAFALRIKARYQKPSQTMFLIDKRRGKTAVWPVVFTL